METPLGFIASVLLWSYTGSHLVVQEGESIVIPCVDWQSPRVNWFKHEKIENSHRPVITRFGNNVSQVHSPWSQEDVQLATKNSLNIKSASYPRDDGFFQCISGGSEEMTLLTVIADVKKVTLSGPELPVPENTEVTFTCEAEGGNPAPNITWEVPETSPQPEPALSDVSSRITLTLTRDMNNQVLVCRAEQADKRFTESMILNIKYKPTVNVRIVPVEYAIGDEVILTCLADGNPRPVISWKFEGNCPGDNMATENSGDKSTATEMKNGEVTRDEEHIPICSMYNIPGLGSKIDHTEIKRETDGNSNEKATGGMIAETNTRNAENVKKAKLFNTTYHIAKLNQSRTGMYSCLAVNSEGNDTAFTNLTLNATKVEDVSTSGDSPSWLLIGVMLGSSILSLLIIACCIYYLSL